MNEQQRAQKRRDWREQARVWHEALITLGDAASSGELPDGAPGELTRALMNERAQGTAPAADPHWTLAMRYDWRLTAIRLTQTIIVHGSDQPEALNWLLGELQVQGARAGRVCGEWLSEQLAPQQPGEQLRQLAGEDPDWSGAAWNASTPMNLLSMRRLLRSAWWCEQLRPLMQRAEHLEDPTALQTPEAPKALQAALKELPEDQLDELHQLLLFGAFDQALIRAVTPEARQVLTKLAARGGAGVGLSAQILGPAGTQNLTEQLVRHVSQRWNALSPACSSLELATTEAQSKDPACAQADFFPEDRHLRIWEQLHEQAERLDPQARLRYSGRAVTPKTIEAHLPGMRLSITAGTPWSEVERIIGACADWTRGGWWLQPFTWDETCRWHGVEPTPATRQQLRELRWSATS